jgi:hypothetical protein
MENSPYDLLLQRSDRAINICKSIMNMLEKRDKIGFNASNNQSKLNELAQMEKTAVSAIQSRLKKPQLVAAVEPFIAEAQSFVDLFVNDTQYDFSDIQHLLKELDEHRDYFLDRWAEDLPSNEELEILDDAPDSELYETVDSIKDRLHRLATDFQLLQERCDSATKSMQAELEPLQTRHHEALKFYDATKPDIDHKLKELDQLLQLSGKKVLNGNYHEQARAEKNAANWLRFGALVTMLAVIAIIGYSFYEATKIDFNMEHALLRLVFSLILSVPAAYMARESSKHRQHQYTLQQTALDIGAIDPYIATLPPEVQNKIKEETATKLFSPKTFEHIGKESYPINIQELITKLVDVAAEKRAEERDAKVKSQKPAEA